MRDLPEAEMQGADLCGGCLGVTPRPGAGCVQGCGRADHVCGLPCARDTTPPGDPPILGRTAAEGEEEGNDCSRTARTSCPTPIRQVDGGEVLAPGSDEEVEIRACTVVAVERLRAALEARSNGSNVPSSVELDWWLWEEGEKRRDQETHHRTVTIYY